MPSVIESVRRGRTLIWARPVANDYYKLNYNNRGSGGLHVRNLRLAGWTDPRATIAMVIIAVFGFEVIRVLVKKSLAANAGSGWMPAAPLDLEPGCPALVEPHDWKSSLRKRKGDIWRLVRDPQSGAAPAQRPLRRTSLTNIGQFLRAGGRGPEHQALLALIGMLVDRTGRSARRAATPRQSRHRQIVRRTKVTDASPGAWHHVLFLFQPPGLSRLAADLRHRHRSVAILVRNAALLKRSPE
jgi:hypothetical protein